MESFQDKLRDINMEMLHVASGINKNPDLGIRPNKVRILEGLGFSKGTKEAVVKDFNLRDIEDLDKFIKYTEGQLNTGRTESILFMRPAYTNVGGSPVVYINKKDDIETLFHLEQEPPFVVAQNGEHVNLFTNDLVKTFSRERGMETRIGGLDNYTKPLNVDLGGGFRMQLDDVRFGEDESILFSWDCSFCFNGYGPRILTLSHKSDNEVPRVRIDANFIYKDGKISLNESNGISIYEAIENADARGVAQVLLDTLLLEQGDNITELLRLLLTIKPALRVHSIAGVYIVDKDNVSTEVIDFDGIDTFDAFELRPANYLEPPERLLKSQLIQSRFVKQDNLSMRDYVLSLRELRSILNGLSESKVITPDMSDKIKEHFFTKDSSYSKSFSWEVQLGRLLNILDIDWIQGDVENVKVYNRGLNSFILVDINGYDLGFWVKSEELIETSDICRIRRCLSESLGIEIIDVHLSGLREGD